MTPSKLKRRKNKRKKPRVEDVYGLSYWLIGNSVPEISIKELTISEIATIGEITILWAYLEHALLYDTARLANVAKLKELPEYADSLSFKKRLAAWRQLVSETVKAPHRREKLLSLSNRIANLEADRHKVTHGLWQWWPYGRAEKLCAYSFRPPVAFRDEKFSHARLSKLADRIGAVCFELTHLSYPKDRKKQGEWLAKTMAIGHRHGPYMSRYFLLAAQGKEPLVLARPEDMRPIQLPQQSASPVSQETAQEIIDRLVEDGDKQKRP